MKKLLYSLFAILAMIACSEGDPENGGNNNNGNQESPKQPQITLETTTADFSTDGGSNVIIFTATDAWTAEVINTRADAWCSITPTSGSAGSSKITISTTANDTTDDRTATIIIKSGSVQKSINVSQKQKDALTVTSSKFEVSADGGEVTIEVKANVDFDFTIDESAKNWVTHRSTRAMKTSTLVFEVDENSDSEKRKANITITSGKLKETVTIYQESNKPSIVLTQNEYTVPSAGETIAVEVKSNVDVTVEMPADVDWITENTTRAVSTNTYYFDIETNNEYDARTAKIKFANKENNLSETVTITQAQKDAIVIAEDNYIIKGDDGEIEIEVNHNVEFDIKIDSDWITQKQTRALEISKLTFVVAENTTDKAREGSITFTSKDSDISQVITIIQNPKVINDSANIIWYCSIDGNIVVPYISDVFGANIILNTISSEEQDYLKKGKIVFDKNITTIGDKAFYDCKTLSSIVVPTHVGYIGEMAFEGCDRLTYIYCKSATPPILGTSVFPQNVYGRKIYVPATSVDAYKNADTWKQYANEIEGYEYGDSHGSNLEDMKDNGTFDW